MGKLLEQAQHGAAREIGHRHPWKVLGFAWLRRHWLAAMLVTLLAAVAVATWRVHPRVRAVSVSVPWWLILGGAALVGVVVFVVRHRDTIAYRWRTRPYLRRY